MLEPDARDLACDEVAVVVTEPAQQTSRREPPGGHHLPHGHGGVAAELRTLREISEGTLAREAVGRLAVEERRPGGRTLEPEHDADQGGLAAAVRPRDGDELALSELQVDSFEDALSRPVAERDVGELDG